MIEDQIERSIYQTNSEKTFVDKLLAKEDSARIRFLMKKSPLSRSDLNELLNLITSVQQKLANFNDWDRYIVLKFFVWVRESVKLGELFYDQQDDWHELENICITCNKMIKTKDQEKKCQCSTEEQDKKFNDIATEYNDNVIMLKTNFGIHSASCELKKVQTPKVQLDKDTKKLFENTMRQMEHNIKFLTDLYLNIVSTTLSLGATAFKEISQNKYEISYPQSGTTLQPGQENKTGGFWRK